ncbi:BON domain-containing protein [Hymenobacter convexus]|uniref:BON domain-containing protein n=1 Tax=Hymenobacter sp. CA1UV-4 TaxID=3063782 RepID=UPI00271380E0|nr:BON domain-containing protein [Hymenobacter sp. CA1UV-4]MDO7850440.1 BON domain-containing protein [Hymenobacter sp. CA1UV-4]
MQTLEAPVLTAEHLTDADITAAIELVLTTQPGLATQPIAVATRQGIVELTGTVDHLLARARAEELALAVRGVRAVLNGLAVAAVAVPDSELYLNVGRALADDPTARDYNLRHAVADGTVTLTGTVQWWPEKQLALRLVQGVRGVRRIIDSPLTVRGGELPKADEDITTQLREQLEWDIRVNKNQVQVRTTDRVVHLAGAVRSAAAKARIVALAEQAGAARVDARALVVARSVLAPVPERAECAPPADADIAQAVREVFRRDPRLAAFQPLVQVHEGAVTVAGTVGSLCARDAAAEAARHVVGVWQVHNLLKVRPDRFWPDADIRQRLADALRRDPYLHGFELSVNVLSGKSYLYGRVDSYFEQEQAAGVAAAITGVVEVENRISVPGDGVATADALAGHLTGNLALPAPLPPACQDCDLAERIRARYFWSASLHGQPVEVQAHHGRVSLTGFVDTWLDRHEAAATARELGARDVNNHLRIRFEPAH